MTPKIYYSTFFNSYEGGHCDPLNRKLILSLRNSVYLNAFKKNLSKELPSLKTILITTFSAFFRWFNPFPNDKMLDETKSKAFADDKLNIAKMTISPLDRVENSVGKGENAGSSLPTVFSKAFFLRVVTSRDCVVKS